MFAALILTAFACGDTVSTATAVGNTTCKGSECLDGSTPVVPEADSGLPDAKKEDPTKDAAPDAPDAPIVNPWVPPVLPTTSVGCGIPKGALNNVLHTTPSGRKFHVWGPSNYNPSTPYPVALTYHGWYTNGADFQYNVTYEYAHFQEVAPSIRAWMDEHFDGVIVPNIEKEGNLLTHYVEFAGREVTAGIATFIATPRFATGYTAIRNRAGL